MLVLEAISLILLILQLILSFLTDLVSLITITSIVSIMIIIQLFSIFVLFRKDKDFRVIDMKKFSSIIKQSSEEQMPLKTRHDKKNSSTINLK